MHLPRVLVVDDELCQRQMLCRALSAFRFRPVAAASATDALKLIPDFRPDLVLADILLPKISGISLLETLRAAPETARLPVILMTGKPFPDEMLAATARGLGVGPIVHKGGDLRVLADRLRTALDAGGDAPLASPSRLLRRGDLIADLDSRKVWLGRQPIVLRIRRSFDLLQALLSSAEPLSGHALHMSIWGGSDNAVIVNVNIMRLRRELRAFPRLRVETLPVGYLLVVDPSVDSASLRRDIESPSRLHPVIDQNRSTT